MNWATIAPETRLYKGKSLFRWDDSPGLEHHCGVCATPLHNGRAKGSCIGKHVEPCYRFHQQLHFLGKSHECFGCNKSDEMHHVRHKDILKILRKITAIDDLEVPSPRAQKSPSVKTRRGSAITSTSSAVTDTSSEVPEDSLKLRRSERKKLRKLGGSKKKDFEIFSQEDMDFVSEAIHLTVHESKGGWEGSYVYDKTLKLDDTIREDGKEISDHLGSLSVKAPGDMTPRQRRSQKKFTTPVKHSSFRGGSKKYTPKGLHADVYDGIDPQILERLGIPFQHPVTNNIARKELIKQLISAIKNDLDVIAQEDLEADIREDGFWRFAGKAAYEKIKRLREDLDWATGQKKGKVMPYSDEEDSDMFEQSPAAPNRTMDLEEIHTPFGASSPKTINTSFTERLEDALNTPKSPRTPRSEQFEIDQENMSMQDVYAVPLDRWAKPSGSTYGVA